MATVYTQDQINTVSRLQSICGAILDQLATARLLIAEATDKGYAAGGANVITDALLQTPNPPQTNAPFPALAAADIAAGINALGTVDTALAATSRAGYKALERLRS